jgi:hypothetical protein
VTPTPITLPLPICICGDPACAIPFGYCHCGCSELAPISKEKTNASKMIRKGFPLRFKRGHFGRRRSWSPIPEGLCVCLDSDCKIPFGECHCGCGEKAEVAQWGSTEKRWEKGKPKKYTYGHHNRIPIEDYYRIEDRGYKTPCWIWNFSLENGYGRLWRGKKRDFGHVFFYEREKGQVPNGLCLDHLCRIRCCVNMDHLEPITKTENVQRGSTAKVNPDVVRQIRKLRLESSMTNREIGERYGIYESMVSSIVNRRTWKNVE